MAHAQWCGPGSSLPARETYHSAVGPPLPAASAAPALARSSPPSLCVAGRSPLLSGLETKGLERGAVPHAGPPQRARHPDSFPPVSWNPFFKSAPPFRKTTQSGAGQASTCRGPGGSRPVLARPLPSPHGSSPRPKLLD